MPWAYYHNVQETFTGFHVIQFPAGSYYGKAGIPISIMASIVLLFMLIPKLWAKRFNLFIAAVLFAYTLRTYIIFTSALFEGEVEKFAGIYLVILLSVVILVCTLFPKDNFKKSPE
ncbi:MAG: hypothetical protein WKF35_04080 [Ferruginibacter sp.]